MGRIVLAPSIQFHFGCSESVYRTRIAAMMQAPLSLTQKDARLSLSDLEPGGHSPVPRAGQFRFERPIQCPSRPSLKRNRTVGDVVQAVPETSRPLLVVVGPHLVRRLVRPQMVPDRLPQAVRVEKAL